MSPSADAVAAIAKSATRTAVIRDLFIRCLWIDSCGFQRRVPHRALLKFDVKSDKRSLSDAKATPSHIQ